MHPPGTTDCSQSKQIARLVLESNTQTTMVSSSNDGAFDVGSGRVTRRIRAGDTSTIQAKVAGGFSLDVSDSDTKCEKGRGKRATWKMVIIGWVLVFTTMLLLSAQLYSHVKTVDPCVQAQMSLGLMERYSSSGSFSSSIPKIIHQQWRSTRVENDPEYRNNNFGDWHGAWHKLYPESEGYKHILWTDDAMLDLITEHYPWFLPVYNSYPANIQRVDASRYFILYHYGGVYADMDYEPLTNFWKYLPSDRVSLIESPYQWIEETQNSLLASPQGHPFWNATFKVLSKDTNKLDVLSSTGPKMLSSVMKQTPSDYWYILPCENFHRIPSAQGASPWHSVMIQQITSLMPQKSCGNFQKKGPVDCQFGRHHNAVLWVKEKGFFKFLLFPLTGIL